VVSTPIRTKGQKFDLCFRIVDTSVELRCKVSVKNYSIRKYRNIQSTNKREVTGFSSGAGPQLCGTRTGEVATALTTFEESAMSSVSSYKTYIYIYIYVCVALLSERRLKPIPNYHVYRTGRFPGRKAEPALQ
jgi:hypothetical protein